MSHETAVQEVVKRLIQSLQEQEKDETTRVNEIQLYIKQEGADVITFLGEVLLDSNERPEIRKALGAALCEGSFPEAVPFLGQIFTDKKQSPELRRVCLFSLGKIPSTSSISYLLKAFETGLEEELRQDTFAILGTEVKRLAPHLKDKNSKHYKIAKDWLDKIGEQFIEQFLLIDERKEIRQVAAYVLGEIGSCTSIPVLCGTLQKEQDLPVLLAIIISLTKFPPDSQIIEALGERLLDDVNNVIRSRALGALQELNSINALPFFCQALILDPDKGIRQRVENALIKIENWHKKTDGILQQMQQLQQGKQHLSNIDISAIIRAIQPSEKQRSKDMYELPDYLIRQAAALHENHWMTAILADLIIESSRGSKVLAGERVNACKEKHTIKEEHLTNLRIEIGGAIALTPVFDVLRKNLEDNFQTPISKLNTKTQNMWMGTTIVAIAGFTLRTLMSIVIFIIGVLLVYFSYQKVMSGNLEPEQLVGSGVSFGSGIITMLLMVYRGPLKEIRQSVNDLGVSSAAFIGYVHRILQISHTFSFHYLNQKMSFEKMEKSNELIDAAMNGTIRMLLQKDNKPEEPSSNKSEKVSQTPDKQKK